ncbi:hypothetical protein V6N13_133623 [Hibiscus sabdariffa]
MVSFAARADRDVSWKWRSERMYGEKQQGSNQSTTGSRIWVFRRVMGVQDEAKGELLESCVVAWCKGSLRGEALATKLHMTGFKGCSVMWAAGDLVLLLFTTLEEHQIRPQEVEVVNSHDISCQCETVDGVSVSFGYRGEGVDVSQVVLNSRDMQQGFCVSPISWFGKGVWMKW